MYNDPSGEFIQILVPVLIKMAVGALYGAAIGAGIGALVYTIKGIVTGNWNVGGFLKATLGGALAGAMAGALNGLGASLFSPNSFLLNSGTWDFMSNMITGVIQDGKIDLVNMGASIIGAISGNKLPKWKGVEGKWFKNAIGETLHSSLKSGITGAILGGFNSLFRGENVWKGMKNGFENGAYNGAGQAAFMIGTFGATYKPTDEQLKYVKKMSEKYGVDYKNVKWRKGGLYQTVVPYVTRRLDKYREFYSIDDYKREVVWGYNVITFRNTTSDTFGHEFGHIIQVERQGWANFSPRGIWEQMVIYGINGINPYKTPGYNEYDAEKMFQSIKNDEL